MTQRFRDYLEEELKDPEFREIYERVSAEEDEKLKVVMSGVTCGACRQRIKGTINGLCPICGHDFLQGRREN